MDKICCQCKCVKDLSDFSKDKNNKDGYTYDCKECRRIKYKIWHDSNPDKIKAKNLSHKEYRKKYYSDPKNKERCNLKRLEREFGLDKETFYSMLSEQNGKCAICRKEEKSIRNNQLAVDHCHKTGKIRGLLCRKCNTGIGLLEDSPEIIKSALEYIIK